MVDTIIHIDGVPVSTLAAEEAMRLADATGRTHFAGFEWTWMPSEHRHRDTNKSVITDSYEVIKASCGWFVWFPPKRGVMATSRAVEAQS